MDIMSEKQWASQVSVMAKQISDTDNKLKEAIELLERCQLKELNPDRVIYDDIDEFMLRNR